MSTDIMVPEIGTEEAVDWDSTWYVQTTAKRGEVHTLRQIIDELVYNAYIAGYQGSKGLGLNYTNAERADMYCREKGLRE